MQGPILRMASSDMWWIRGLYVLCMPAMRR